MTTGTISTDETTLNLPRFQNTPLTDFSVTENRRAMQEALTTVRGRLGEEYPLLIGGREVFTEGKQRSFNPARSEELVGVFQKATVEHVEEAVAAADAAFEEWKRVPAAERVRFMLRVSEAMQERRLELAAWMVIEVGKSWVEADADVAEAIDFCEYYSRQMLRLDDPDPLVENEGEENHLRYIPLGVGVVIPPWNFPLAILAGMTFATVVAGNTAIVKPSSDSPTIAAQLVNIMVEVGCPPGVVNFLPGSGSVIGDPLVLHHRVRFIAFTGSKEVGLRINELAARPQPGQIWIKRVVAEMGGKDSIVVAEDADLESAAQGIVAAAFGFQGQKCSACSRAILVDSVYDEVLDRVVALTRETVVEGNVEEGVNFGPVINAGAMKSILGYIDKGRHEGRLALGGETGDPAGHFVRPTIIADVDPEATIAQEEIFGPVLAVIRARDFDHALEIANNTEFGLTGSLYSGDKSRLERAADEFHVGNLYLNRKCTGALVGVHPFGGFNMSGTDSKAGGPDYLLLFTQAKSISKKT